MINRYAFYAAVRGGVLFAKGLTQSQVDGFNAILAEWDARKLTDTRWLAYMLATTYHETARTIQPIAEYGGKKTRYAPYYGRGFVQVTWEANYKKLGDVVGVDLVKSPDRAMELPIATVALFDGMIQGWFTSKKLGDYIHGSVCDYVNARRIINGTDKANTIAGYAAIFEKAIKDVPATAPQAPVETPKPVPAPVTAPAPKVAPVSATASAWGRLFAAILALIKKVL